MLHLLENMVAVPCEKAQKHEDRRVRRPSLKGNTVLHGSPSPANQSKMSDLNRCKNSDKKRTKDVLSRKKCAKLKVCTAIWQIKEGRITQSSRSRKE